MKKILISFIACCCLLVIAINVISAASLKANTATITSYNDAGASVEEIIPQNCQHQDLNNDGWCDICNSVCQVIDNCQHYDNNNDGVCDNCNNTCQDVNNCNHYDSDDECDRYYLDNNDNGICDNQESNNDCDLYQKQHHHDVTSSHHQKHHGRHH